MDRERWEGLFEVMDRHSDIVRAWEPALPDPAAARCEESRHRTLAHLRACQEQWLEVALAFGERDSPSVKVLHPWRRFDQEGYASLPWTEHLVRFEKDRARWKNLRDGVDWNRGGRWNQKPDTIGGLTKRLVDHEAHHLRILR